MKLPISISPEKYKKICKEKNHKILYNFITRINEDLLKGCESFFEIPKNRYIGMVDDVIKHFELFGWKISTSDSETAIFLK